jgi:RHS repeat-associated protein
MKTQKLIVRAVFFAVVLLLARVGMCQTGTPPFSSTSGGPDAVDLGNLNVHVAVPFFSKAGRGLPLSYTMSYDSSVWYPVTVSGSTTWTAVGNYGWRGNTEAAMGYATYKVGHGVCYDSYGRKWTNGIFYYRFWVYHDQFGTAHSFNGETDTSDAEVCDPQVDDPSFTAVATDGSGYTLIVTNYTDAQIVSPAGFVTTPPVQDPSGSGTATDRNGNQLTTSGSTVTDTLGTSALSITGSVQTGITYIFQTTGNGTNHVTVTYSPYTVQTAFGCSGISETTITGVYLPTSISRSDGFVTYQYQFAYEQTPGYGTGYTTGRLTQVTLPTGGTIAYTYTNGNFTSGASNGVVCADGTAAGFTRTLSAGTDEGHWTYARGLSGSTGQTTVTDPQGNDTVLNFSGIYETSRLVYQGHQTGGTLLKNLYRCWNNNFSNCQTQSVSAPITKVDYYDALTTGFTSGHEVQYNSYGLPYVVKDWDYGNDPATGIGALLREVDTSYANLGNGIVDRPSTVTVKNGSGATSALTNYTYDETSGTGHCSLAATSAPQHQTVSGARGNLTTVSQWVSGTTYANSELCYDDTGNVVQIQDPGSHITTYSYSDSYSDNTNHNTLAFVTQVTYPNTGVAHVVSTKYDWPTGLLYSSTDQNGQATSYNYDSLLRLTRVLGPGLMDRPEHDYIYPNTQQIENVQVVSGSGCGRGGRAACRTDSWTEVDGLGRPSRTARNNGGEAGGAYDQADTCYNPVQMTAFASYPYQGGGIGGSPNGTKQCATGDTSAYDALGRISSVTHSTDTAHPVSYSYYGRAMSVQDEGNGSGTSVTHVYQQDGLGRTTSVCEVASFTAIGTGGSPADCGLDLTGKSGFTTTYTYDPLGNVLSVSQGSLQQRTSTYDGVSRLLNEFIPEANSTTTYTYNSDGTLYQRARPKANQSNSSVLTTTTYAYDAMHRLTSVSYDDSSTATNYYYYDQTSIWGASPQNPTGRVTSYVGVNNTGGILSYDSMGRVVDNWQCPLNGLCWRLSSGYDLAGQLTSATNGGGATFTYTRNVAGRLTQMSSSGVQAPSTLLSSATYNALGERTADTLGNGVSETFVFDTPGRLVSVNAVHNGTTVYGLSGPASNNTQISFAPNGNLLGTNDFINGNWTYTYDALDRLNTANKTGTSISYNNSSPAVTVDRNANLWTQYINGNPAPGLSFDQTKNQITGSSTTYDAAGNMRTWNDGGSTHTYTYDAEGRIVSIDSGSVQYFYDVFGRRMRKVVSGTATDYLFDVQGNLFGKFTDAGAWLQGEIWADGRHLGSYTGTGGTTYFSHQDWLGTERVRTDASGNSAETCTSNPYGDNSACTGLDPSPIHFAGMEYDTETGFYHTPYRYYNPRTFAWLTPDPAGLAAADLSNPQSLNRYAYALNSPTNYIDPEGLNADSLERWRYCDSAIPGGIEHMIDFAKCVGDGGSDGGPGGWPTDPVIGIGIGIGWGDDPGSGTGNTGTTGSTGNPGGIGNFPNGEHLGLPTGYNFGGLSLCQLTGLCPIGPSCGNSIVGVDDIVVIGGLVYLTGVSIYVVQRYGPGIIDAVKRISRTLSARCEKVLQQCQDKCWEQVQGQRVLPQDKPGLLRKCARQCMQAQGCYNY